MIVVFYVVYTNLTVDVLIRDLKRSDANGFVQRAVSAANVYNNIVKYIDDANDTAVSTHSLSERAGDVRQNAHAEDQYIHPIRQRVNLMIHANLYPIRGSGYTEIQPDDPP